MSITILTDEGYAFDYLAILLVKSRSCAKGSPKEFNKAHDLLMEQCSHLTSILGRDSFQRLFSSPEFDVLTQANQDVFDLIDQLRAGKPITAKQIDDANLERFRAKNIFRNKFFPDSQPAEMKIMPRQTYSS